jgi:F0F1-type ATP synthase assembly protein I
VHTGLPQQGNSKSVWGAVVGRAIGLQWAVVFALAVAAGLWAGKMGAVSAFLGGAAVAVPNALLALWLTLRVRQFGALSTAALLLGEFLKLGLTLAMLALVVARFRHGMVWPALIVGVIGALKAQWLALWFTRDA